MLIPQSVKSLARKAFRSLGVDLVRANENTSETWLSLRNNSFGCVIDVGANEGQFATIAAAAFPNAELHCFEPLQDPFEKLSRFAIATNKTRIHCYPIALGDEPGELEFEAHLDHTSSSSFLPATDIAQSLCPPSARVEKRLVEISTLDQALPPSALDRSPVLLKLDVQGFEDRVLRGAAKSLLQVDAAMIEVMFANFYTGQARFIDIVSLLDRGGLHYVGNVNQVYDRDGSVLWADCIFVRDPRKQHA